MQLIIGADIYNDVVLAGRCKGEVGEATAQHSIFGWFISGPVEMMRELPRDHHVAVHHCHLSPSLEEALTRFWEVEEIPQ